MIRNCRQHLEEAKCNYFGHLLHSVHQSNRLIIAALKSYVHGLFPCFYKSDAPKVIVKIYRDIKDKKHLRNIIGE